MSETPAPEQAKNEEVDLFQLFIRFNIKILCGD